MSSRFLSNQQDPFSGTFNSAWNDPTFVNFQTSADGLGGNSPTPPTPALSNEAIEAEAAQAGPTSTVVVTSGGITFDLIFDAAATAAPASFRAGIEQAASILAATITNKITVNLEIDYSGTGGGAAAGPDNGQFVNYTTVRADLVADATPGDTSFNALPTGSTIQGQSQVAVWNAQLKVFGLLAPNAATDDGSATFATDINPSLLVGVALHELTHAMGRVPYGPQPDIFDFYRYTSPGTLLFTDNIPATAAYFSLDGGNTKIADYGQTSDPSDFLNSPGSSLTPTDAFDEFYSNNTNQFLTAIDKEQLDALGFNLAPDTGPVMTVPNLHVSLANGQSIAASSLFSATAGAGYTVTEYRFVDSNNVGNFVVNGVVEPNVPDSAITVTVAQLAQTTFVAGSGQADLAVQAFDGTAWGPPVSFTAGQLDTGPVMTVPNLQVSLANGQSIAASSLFSATAGAGYTVTEYRFLDSNNVGDFVVNGVVEPNVPNSAITVTVAQLAQTTFVAGSGQADLAVQAFDGTAWGPPVSFTAGQLDTGPVMTVPNLQVSLANGQSVAASSLFSATAGAGYTVTEYRFLDSNNVGDFVVNGVVEPNVPDSAITVTVAQLAQTTFVAGSGQADLAVQAFDGTAWGPPVSFTAGQLDTGPVMTVPNLQVSLANGQSIAASSLFSATAGAGYTVTEYRFLDSNNVGDFVVNGVVEPNVPNSAITVTVAQLAQTTFVAGSGQADLAVQAFDGTAWGPPVSFTVGTGANTTFADANLGSLSVGNSSEAQSQSGGHDGTLLSGISSPASGQDSNGWHFVADSDQSTAASELPNTPTLESTGTSIPGDLNGDGVVPSSAPPVNAGTTSTFADASSGSIKTGGSSVALPQNGTHDGNPLSGVWSATSEASNGWHFDFAAHPGGGSSTVEPGPSAPWHDAQAGQQPPAFTPVSSDHETVLHQDGTTAATGFFADLHAGHFFFH
jgi:hypothetical protein